MLLVPCRPPSSDSDLLPPVRGSLRGDTAAPVPAAQHTGTGKVRCGACRHARTPMLARSKAALASLTALLPLLLLPHRLLQAGQPLRHSQDLCDPSDARDQQLGSGATPIVIPPSGTAPKQPLAAAAAGGLLGTLQPQSQQQQQPAPLVQELRPAGSKRTQALIEANMQLAEPDKDAYVSQARCKGNEFFR